MGDNGHGENQDPPPPGGNQPDPNSEDDYDAELEALLRDLNKSELDALRAEIATLKSEYGAHHEQFHKPGEPPTPANGGGGGGEPPPEHEPEESHWWFRTIGGKRSKPASSE